jgi:hypothetical protein
MTMNKKNRDNFHKILLPPLFLAFILFLAPSASRATEFTLLYSNDNHGEIEPCG